MDTVTTAKTWIDFAYHAFDKAWPFLAPVITGLLGWLLPSPMKRGRK